MKNGINEGSRAVEYQMVRAYYLYVFLPRLFEESMGGDEPPNGTNRPQSFEHTGNIVQSTNVPKSQLLLEKGLNLVHILL